MENKIIVRDAQIEDVSTLAHIRRDSWIDTYPNKEANITREDIESMFENIEENIISWKKRLETNSPQVATLVAVENDMPVGFCIVDLKPELRRIRAIYLKPESKGKGTGTLLMNEALKRLGREDDIFVDVTDYNENAIRFYKKFGFEDTRKRFKDEKFRMKNGSMMTEIKMVLKAISAA